MPNQFKNKDEEWSILRVRKEDMQFFTKNVELEKYLVLKYKEMINDQLDLTKLIRKELEEILERNIQNEKKK